MDGFYTCEQVAEMTGRKPVSIARLARRWDRGQKITGAWFFTDEDVDFFKSIHPNGGRPRKKGGHYYDDLKSPPDPRLATKGANDDGLD